jgi:hypothetical protein
MIWSLANNGARRHAFPIEELNPRKDRYRSLCGRELLVLRGLVEMADQFPACRSCNHQIELAMRAEGL